MNSPQLQSVQAGHKQEFRDAVTGRAWQSAIIKEPVAGRVKIHEAGIEGDEQFDRINHGGVDKAVLAYSADHFDAWREQYLEQEGSPSIGGAFGENLTVSSQVESDVCIGDIVQIGSCKLQVSQPRQPCWKLSRRWGLADLAKRVQESGRTGWYLRVVETGELEAGDLIELVERLHPEWTIKAANHVLYTERSIERDRELAGCPSLSESWKDLLLHRSVKLKSNPDAH